MHEKMEGEQNNHINLLLPYAESMTYNQQTVATCHYVVNLFNVNQGHYPFPMKICLFSCLRETKQ